MRILFVLEHFYPYLGGAEKLFYDLSTSLAKEGNQIVIITTQFDKNMLLHETHKGVEIIRINCRNRFAFTLFSLPKVLMHARKSDVIHTTSYNAALPAMIAGFIFRKPVFVTFHEVWGELWKKLPFISSIQKYEFYYFEKMLLRLPFTKFIAVSKFTKSKLQENGVKASKINCIYNGMDYHEFDKLMPEVSDIFTFTYFGRLGISKGLNLLIPAAARFKAEFPKSRLKLIIPKKPAALYLKIMNMIKEYDLEEYVTFKNNLPKSELFDELLMSSCIVIPSYSEGFCYSATEAVALRIPIISSHQGALPETVSGKFIQMKEMTIDALTEALDEAYHDRWEYKPIRRFELVETVNMYKKLYNE